MEASVLEYLRKEVNVLESDFCQLLYRAVMLSGSLTLGRWFPTYTPVVAYEMHRLVVRMKAGMALLLGCWRPSPPFLTAIVHINSEIVGRSFLPIRFDRNSVVIVWKFVVISLS